MNLIKKIKIKNKLKNKHITFSKVMCCLAILISITFLSYGYAFLEEKIEIAGNVDIEGTTGVRIISVENTDIENGGVVIDNPQYTANSVALYSMLPNLNSTVSYRLEIHNYNPYTMMLKTFEISAKQNDNFDYTISGITEGDELLANENSDIIISIHYDESVTELPSELEGYFVFTLEFTDNVNYSTPGSLLLDLRGTTAPVNNEWIDRINNNPITLNNVIYDEDGKRFVFNGEGYGVGNMPFIPETTDFTAEVYFITQGVDYPTNTDQALISQVADDTNSAGRFKLNIRKNSNASSLPYLSAWYNNTSNNSNVDDVAFSGLGLGKVYLLQVTRTNGKLYTYINGKKTNEYTLSSSAKISQNNLKISRFTNASKQPFTGSIFSIRIYNEALSDDELLNNYNVDKMLYGTTSLVKKDLQTYIFNHHVVTSGDGLYLDGYHYIYSGVNPNNYLSIDNKLWRIMSLEPEGTMKIISIDNVIKNIAFDESGNRNSTTSTYCNRANQAASDGLFHGCNMWYKPIDGTIISTGSKGTATSSERSSGYVVKDSSLNTYLNTVWYNSLPSLTKSMIEVSTWNVGSVTSGADYVTAHEEEKTETWTGKVGLPSACELIEAGLNYSSTISTNSGSQSNYMLTYTSTTKFIWTLTRQSNDSWDVFVIEGAGGGLSGRRASRTTQDTIDYYAYPVVYIDGTITVSGLGTLDDPFVVITTKNL